MIRESSSKSGGWKEKPVEGRPSPPSGVITFPHKPEDFIYVTVYAGVAEEGYVGYADYKTLLAVYTELEERHQKLLDLAGGHYL